MTTKPVRCRHIFTKGNKKGLECQRQCRTIRDLPRCGEHKAKPKTDKEEVEELNKIEENHTNKEMVEYILILLSLQEKKKGKPKMTMFNIGEVWKPVMEESYKIAGDKNSLEGDLYLSYI